MAAKKRRASLTAHRLRVTIAAWHEGHRHAKRSRWAIRLLPEPSGLGGHHCAGGHRRSQGDARAQAPHHQFKTSLASTITITITI